MNDDHKKWLNETPVGELRAIEACGVRYEVDRRMVSAPWPAWMGEPAVVTKGGGPWVNPEGPEAPTYPIVDMIPPGWRA
jgi:hypothetical protein